MKALDHDTVDAVGDGSDEGDSFAPGRRRADGDAPALDAELARLRVEGQEGIALTRRCSGGDPAGPPAGRGSGQAAAPLPTWRHRASHCSGRADRPAGSSRGGAPLLAKAVSRLIEAEREVKARAESGPLRGRRRIVRDQPAAA